MPKIKVREFFYPSVDLPGGKVRQLFPGDTTEVTEEQLKGIAHAVEILVPLEQKK